MDIFEVIWVLVPVVMALGILIGWLIRKSSEVDESPQTDAPPPSIDPYGDVPEPISHDVEE